MLSKTSPEKNTPIHPFICEQDFDASCTWIAIPFHIRIVSTSFSKACDQGNRVVTEFVELLESLDKDQMNTWVLGGDQTFKQFNHRTDFTIEGNDYVVNMHQYAIVKFSQPRAFQAKQLHVANVLDAMYLKSSKYQNNKGSKVEVGLSTS